MTLCEKEKCVKVGRVEIIKTCVMLKFRVKGGTAHHLFIYWREKSIIMRIIIIIITIIRIKIEMHKP